MATTRIGDVAIGVSADVSPLERDLRKGSSTLKRFGTQAKKQAANIAKIASAAALAGAAITAELTRRGLGAVDAQAKLARQLGITQAEMAGLTRAASDAGIEEGKLRSNIQALNKRLGEAQQGTGRAADTLDRLGLSADQLARMPIAERMDVIGAAINGLSTDTEKASATADLFSRSGLDMVNVFNQGEGAIARATEEARLFGTAVTEVDAAKVEAANDAMSRIQDVVQGIANSLAVTLAPILKAVSDQITDTAKEAGGLGNVVTEQFNKVVQAASFVMNAVDGVRRLFQSVADLVIAQWSGMAAAVSSAILKIIQVIDSIPGVDMSGAIQSVERFRDTAVGVAGEAMSAIGDKMNEPLAGDAFKGFIERAQQAGQQAAEAAAGARDAALGGGGGTESGDPAEAEKQKERLDRIRAQLNEEFAIKQEHNERMAELEALRQEGVLTSDAEFEKLRLESQRRMNERLESLERNKNDTLESLTSKHWGATQATTIKSLQGIASVMEKNNKGMFAANKAFGIADALISTYQGIASALKLPFPANLAAAAKTAATGFAAVNNIKSTSFGSKSTKGTGAAGGGGSAAGAQQQQKQPQRQVADVTFNVSGGGMMRDLARQLVEPMNDLKRDGFEIGNVGVA